MKGHSRLATSKFHSVDYLKTPAAIAAYLSEAFEAGDTDYILSALETAARAKGVPGIAAGPGGASKLEFETVRKVMNSLGVRLVAEPIEGKKKPA